MKKTIEVRLVVEVEMDETKFDAKFLQEFRDGFYPFHSLEDHACHIAQLYARGLYGGGDEFIEGYGPAKDMGIKAKGIDQDEEVVDE